jgi:MFS family permease
LIDGKGTSVVAAWGTVLWGFAVASAGVFLARLNFIAILLSLVVGGIGVGWTYLAVVVLVGQALPNHSLARSAIGPMGFSFGTATCIVLDSAFHFASLDAKSLGNGFTSAGIGFIVVGAATMLFLLSEEETKRKPPSLLKARKSESEFFFSILLFFNALPGMVMFNALLPFAFYHTRGTTQSSSILALQHDRSVLWGVVSSVSQLKARAEAHICCFVLPTRLSSSPAFAIQQHSCGNCLSSVWPVWPWYWV